MRNSLRKKFIDRCPSRVSLQEEVVDKIHQSTSELYTRNSDELA
jgi:hypothetical protein